MQRPDDSTLSLSQLARVRKEAERALREGSVLGILPTPVEQIMAVARVREVEEDMFNPSFIAKIMGKAEKTGQAIKRALSKVMGLFHASEGLVFLDQTLILVRKRFIRLHESAHGFLPWQRPMYAIVEDCEKSLDPETADLFDREANMFASEVLFQLDTFHDMAEQMPFEIKTPKNLARKFNASVYSSIRQYVAKNQRACAVVVLNMPEFEVGVGFRATLRRVVQSNSFKAMFYVHHWKDSYTPDDEIGALVPIGKQSSSGKQMLGITDANGTLHECVAESFTNTYQVFVLIHAVRTLTAKRILLGAVAFN